MYDFQNKLQRPPYPVEPKAADSGYGDKKFLHTYIAGALLPLLQAVITGFVMMALTVTLLWLWDVVDILKPAITVGVVAAVVMWVVLQARWLNLTRLEHMLGVDLNRDGMIGGERELKTIRVQLDKVTERGHMQQWKQFDLPISHDQLIKLATGTLQGIPFSERKWTGPGQPFSSQQFRQLRSEAIKRELLVPVSGEDHRQGFAWTEDAMNFFEQVTKDSPTEAEAS